MKYWDYRQFKPQGGLWAPRLWTSSVELLLITAGAAAMRHTILPVMQIPLLIRCLSFLCAPSSTHSKLCFLLAWRKYASCLYSPCLSHDGNMSRFALPVSPFLLFLLLSKLVICVPTDHATVEHVHWQRDEMFTTTRGWVTSPNGRGTLGIIWSCILTISLCSWSTLCLNLPAVGDSYFRIVRRKIYMTGLGILGPEIILQLALGQWASARRSVELFHSSGYTSWTMTHAFFADMGGFILQPKGSTPFPLTALQLHYLVKEGYLRCPDVDKKTLQDKDKGQTFVRIITIIQICWFLLNCIGRGAHCPTARHNYLRIDHDCLHCVFSCNELFLVSETHGYRDAFDSYIRGHCSRDTCAGWRVGTRTVG